MDITYTVSGDLYDVGLGADQAREWADRAEEILEAAAETLRDRWERRLGRVVEITTEVRYGSPVDELASFSENVSVSFPGIAGLVSSRVPLARCTPSTLNEAPSTSI